MFQVDNFSVLLRYFLLFLIWIVDNISALIYFHSYVHNIIFFLTALKHFLLSLTLSHMIMMSLGIALYFLTMLKINWASWNIWFINIIHLKFGKKDILFFSNIFSDSPTSYPDNWVTLSLSHLMAHNSLAHCWFFPDT